MTKHRYEVSGISGVDEKQFRGECISDDIKKVIDMFREQKLSVHKIWRMEQVHADTDMKITKIELINDSCNWECNTKVDMRQKVKEYIDDLEQEINRCISLAESNMGDCELESNPIDARIMALTEVKDDLQSRLEEII